MYQPHPLFEVPTNEHVKIWRYMDVTKLLSLLDSNRLFFTRADLFEDPFEGSWPQINIDDRELIPQYLPSHSPDQIKIVLESLTAMSQSQRKNTAINCWHMNEYESAAMWKLYLTSAEGIAVQSTFSRLKNCLHWQNPVFIGMVKYIDYNTQYINAANSYSPFIHKRKSYEHEKEIRAVIVKHTENEDGSIDLYTSSIDSGISVPVDIEMLIENIFISPTAPKWFTELIQAIIVKYDYNFNVVQSELKNAPLW